MRFHYYKETDSLYISRAARPSANSDEVAPGIILDFDGDGNLTGIDIQHVSQTIVLSRLEIDNMPTRNYQDDLLKRLAEREYAAHYLKAALDETMHDGNMEAFLLALKNIVDATDAVQNIAEEAGVSRQHLYRMLSGSGNPTLETLTSVLEAVGLTIDFRPAED